MRLHVTSMTVRMALGVTAAVVLSCSAGAYFYSAHHFKTLLESARAAAKAQGELVRVALEHQMIENDRSLIAKMIRSFGTQPNVEQVVVLDRNGVLRYASQPAARGEDFRIASPTCQACHQFPPSERGSSRVIDTRGGEILRTVVPIHNRQACYGCHDPSHKINGILILDYNVEPIRVAMARDMRWLVGGTGALTLLLMGGIAILFRIFVIRRLQRFETTARQIASGDLKRRVRVAGSDTLSWLAREFNTMADSMTGLVSEVQIERERLETVINSIDDGIVVIDRQRRIIAANDAFLERLRRPREQVLGACCRDFGPGACEVDDCPSLACLGSGERQVRICERRTDDGGVVSEEVHSSPILDKSGHLSQVVEVWRDISERRAAEAHLADAHRLASIGLLASGFSHELNTPLATVLMCVEGILRESSGEAGGAADLELVARNAAIAREQVLRCRGITQHFLRMSRGERSSGEILDLSQVVGAAQRLVGPKARASGVAIQVRPVPDHLRVKADEADLQHALINLLLNAIQACGAGGKVTVETLVSESIRIRITDNGCGIAPEYRERIFEPFFSLRNGGTGLGLFLSLSFVRRWGGDILLESETGAGAAFEMVLPLSGAMGDESTA